MPLLRVNGTEIHYEITGEGPPLLLIHGLGSSGRDWELQVPRLAEQYQVVTFDVRGHGRSAKPPGPYSVSQFAADGAELIRALGIAPVHVVGISMGGMIAFQLAVDAPGLVRSLTIVNSGPALLVRTVGERLQLWQRFLIVRLLGMRKMGEVLSKRLFPKAEHKALRQTFVERWADNDPRAYRDSMRALVNWSVMEQIPSITCPVLVVAADQDYTPVALKEAYVSKLPAARLVVIPDSRHALPIEKPDEFNDVLADFLRSVTRNQAMETTG